MSESSMAPRNHKWRCPRCKTWVTCEIGKVCRGCKDGIQDSKIGGSEDLQDRISEEGMVREKEMDAPI